MPSVAINNIKNAIQGGARSNKYRVYVDQIADAQAADLLCKSSTFPGRTLGEIEVFNQGRKYIIPGDTSFTNEWTLSFYNTQDHKLRLEFIQWMKQIDDFSNNVRAADVTQFLKTMKVYQINNDGSEGQGYVFNNVFPKDIGEITVEAETLDAIQEFDVTFSFTDWEVI